MESRAFLLTERRQEPYAQRPARSYITLWGAGGEIARNARMELEAKTGEKAITALNAKQGILKNKNQ